MPYLQIAGESDVYEVTSSQIALKRSQNPEVRAFATMLIGHHTMTTNLTLAAAQDAGLVPPAVRGQGTRSQIDQLLSGPVADFDRIYLTQQVPAHEQALAVYRPTLRKVMTTRRDGTIISQVRTDGVF